MVVGSYDGLLYAIRRDGTVLWAFRTGDRIQSSALIDASGAILVGSQDDRLYAIEPDGKLRWSVEHGGTRPHVEDDGVRLVALAEHLAGGEDLATQVLPVVGHAELAGD